jgi:hypothetical protein
MIDVVLERLRADGGEQPVGDVLDEGEARGEIAAARIAPRRAP